MTAHQPSRRTPVGRGTASDPPNRFESRRVVPDDEQAAWSVDEPFSARKIPTQFLPDQSQTIIASNDSPDIPFRYSINPYRGCEHGCAYCYARPTHERLGMSAGLDFETRILVKYDAVRLLRKALVHPRWSGETIALSGVTDCYQPCERELKLTRGLLEVMLEACQSTTIVTKNALVLRDIDVISALARQNLVRVAVSITSLDAPLVRKLEPRTSAPDARLRAVTALRDAGVPVGVMVSPVIPGLTDHEMAQVLAAARRAGAMSAAHTLLRLPQAVGPLFLEWLDNHRPAARKRVEALIRSTRGGGLDDARFGCRMVGDAAYAEGIAASFRLFARQQGLDRPLPPLDTTRFRPPRAPDGQMQLF